MVHDRISVLNKEISKDIKWNLKNRKYERITITIGENKIMKVIRGKLGNWKILITKFQEQQRDTTSNREEIV